MTLDTVSTRKVKRIVRQWLEGPEFDKISVSSIEDSQDGQEWETLREAGYEKGDVLVLNSAPVRGTGALTTTSTSYTTVTSPDLAISVPEDLIEVGDFIIGFTGAMKNDTSGETTFARLEYDFTVEPDTEESISSTTANFVRSTPVNVDSGKVAARIDIQMKVTAGTGSLNQPCVFTGVRI